MLALQKVVILVLISTLKSSEVIESQKTVELCAKIDCVDENKVWCEKVVNDDEYEFWTLSTCYRESEHGFYGKCCKSCCNLFKKKGYSVGEFTTEKSTTTTTTTTVVVPKTTTTTTEKSTTEKSTTTNGGSGEEDNDDEFENLIPI